MLKKLREIRLEKGFSITYMANKLKISVPFYSQIENERRLLSYKMALNISNILNKKPDDIFYEEFKERM